MIDYNILKKAIEDASKQGVNYIEVIINNCTCRIDLTLANQWLIDLI